jgi:hypothetical protein
MSKRKYEISWEYWEVSADLWTKKQLCYSRAFKIASENEVMMTPQL